MLTHAFGVGCSWHDGAPRCGPERRASAAALRLQQGPRQGQPTTHCIHRIPSRGLGFLKSATILIRDVCCKSLSRVLGAKHGLAPINVFNHLLYETICSMIDCSGGANRYGGAVPLPRRLDTGAFCFCWCFGPVDVRETCFGLCVVAEAFLAWVILCHARCMR